MPEQVVPQPLPPETTYSDQRKVSVYLPEDMYEEIRREAKRLDRGMSWVAQQAWRIARRKMLAAPSLDELSHPNNAGELGVKTKPRNMC